MAPPQNQIPANALNLRGHDNPLDESRLLHHHHRRLPPPELQLMEDRIVTQSREIQILLHDNQRLAVTHVALKQELVATEQDLRHLSTTAASVKSDRDAQVREVFERSLKLEAEARSINGLAADLDRVRADIKELRAEREELSEKLKGIDADLTTTRSELGELPSLKAEIEVLRREVQRGRAAIEYERKMHAHNFELSEAMEKHIISMAREAQKLRSELANAEKRAMAAAAAAAAVANPGPGYATHNVNLETGYGSTSLSNPYIVHQGSVDGGPHYGVMAGPQAPPSTYDIQQQQVHS